MASESNRQKAFSLKFISNGIRCLLSFFIIYPQIYAESNTADNRRFWVINSANELICANPR